MKKEFFEKFSDSELSKIHEELCQYHKIPVISNKEVFDFVKSGNNNSDVGNNQTRCGRCIRLIEINMVKRFKYKF